MAEFALVAPVLILLFFGLTFAAFYAFRAAASDWGVFITGITAGSYGSSSTDHARSTIAWRDIAEGIRTDELHPETRAVRSQITIQSSRSWVFEVRPMEAHRATTFFRLWRFYPGPPTGSIQ